MTDPPKLRVLLVTRNLPPLVGGMERLNWHLADELSQFADVLVVGPKGSTDIASKAVALDEVPLKPLPMFLAATLWRSFIFALQYRPRWIQAGSGLVAPIALLAARCSGARSAVYLHGLDIVAPSRIYQWLWLPFIRKFDLVLVNSANTAQLAFKHGVSRDKLHVLHPGTNLPVLERGTAFAFRERHGFGQRRLLLSVGRLTQRKGLTKFIAQSLPNIVAYYPDVLLVIIGGEASDALHVRSGSEQDRIRAAAESAGVSENVRFLGRCDEKSLHAAYQASNLHVFPVLDLPGDVEGFGMVALEAAAHGLPTVAFAVGGVPDAVQDGQTGSLIQSDDYPGMSKAIIHWLANSPASTTVEACRAFAAGKTWPVFGKRLRYLLDSSHV